MSEVKVNKPSGMPLPVVRTEEDDEFPDPEDQSIKPILALQLFFLPYLIFYLLISIIVTIVSGNFGLLVLSSLSIIVFILGKVFVKNNYLNPLLCRTIAVRVLTVEVVIFAIWQIKCLYMFMT